MKLPEKSRLLAIVILVCIGAIASCSGGSGSETSSVTSGVSQGMVTAKGSVFVNGIEYNTSSAVITIDDNPAVENDLKVGMTVKVQGSSDDATRLGTASKIESRDALEGTIDFINSANQTLIVMGQTVQIEDNVTRLNDDDNVKIFSNANFLLGNFVEVNGYADDIGNLHATRVAKKALGEFEAKGFVGSLSASSFSLSRNSGGTAFITVNYSPGQLPPGVVNGTLLQVKATAAPVAGTVTASLIKLEDKLGASGEQAKIEGIVTSGTLAGFVINGQQIATSASTAYEGGLGSDFALGLKLEAEGTLNSSGVLVASKISFRSNIMIEADASAVSATGLTVLGKAIAINPLTRFDSALPANGNHIEVRAMTDRNGNLIATRIKVLGASTKVLMQGLVTAQNSAAGTLTILGFTLVSDGGSEWRASSTSGEIPVNQAAFYARLKTGTSIVKVKWDPFNIITDPIKEAEIELGK